MAERLASTKSNRFNAFILYVYSYFFVSKSTILDFTLREDGIDYIFESFNQGVQGYLTIQCDSIKPGIYVLLSVDGSHQKYEVREVSFYASPEDMCVAHLVRIGRQESLQ
jgi:hypothetical protein